MPRQLPQWRGFVQLTTMGSMTMVVTDEVIRQVFENHARMGVAPTDDPPIFVSLGPMPVWSPPPTQRFTVYGYKRRQKLVKDAARVLKEKGFK